MCVCVCVCVCLWGGGCVGCNKAAASHSKINIVEGWKQESVCFRFRLLRNERNNNNLWEDRVAKGVEEATVY